MKEKLIKLNLLKPQQLSRYFQIHPTTKKMVEGRDIILHEVLEATSWLPNNSSYRHRHFVIFNSLTEYPKCKECSDDIIWKYKTPEDVDRKYCGLSCASIVRQRENKEIYSKSSKKGHSNKDQVEIGRKISNNKASWSESFWEEVLLKKKITAIKNGNQIKDEYLTDWRIYQKLVKNLTAKVDVSHLVNIEYRGLAGIDGAYQLDHMVSVFEGFTNNIPIHVIASINNLQMLPWKENLRKGKTPFKEWV